MKYFDDCKTAETLKKKYQKWAKALHPDNNPGKDTTAAFQEMQAEFSAAWDRLKDIHQAADGETYERETTETAAEFMDIIDRLTRIVGIDVELCGSWLWVTGDTKPAKDLLKQIGFRWAAKKGAWYYHREPWYKKGGRMTLDEIRAKFGTEKFASKSPDSLTT